MKIEIELVSEDEVKLSIDGKQSTVSYDGLVYSSKGFEGLEATPGGLVSDHLIDIAIDLMAFAACKKEHYPEKDTWDELDDYAIDMTSGALN